MTFLTFFYWVPCVVVLIYSIIARFAMGISVFLFFLGIVAAFIPMLNIIVAIISLKNTSKVYGHLKGLLK